MTACPSSILGLRLDPHTTRLRFLATAALVWGLGGCVNHGRFPEDVAKVRWPLLWLMVALAILAVWALILAIYRDARRRGTYLGILFAALGEAAVVQRLPPDDSTVFNEMLIAWLQSVATAGITARIVAQIAFVAIVTAALLILARGISRRLGMQGKPNSGLAAYFVTLGVLLLFDLTIARSVYSFFMSLLIT